VTPLGQVLAFKLGIELTAARETVSAVHLDARAARVLGCRRGMAAFRSDRVSLAADGTPVVYDRVLIPGDRFRITRELRYDGAVAALHANAAASALTAASSESRPTKEPTG
jgi:hypothetical protein